MFGREIREVSVRVSTEKCTGCMKCVEKCRHQAMKMHYREDKGYAWHAYPDRCVGCGRCEKACKEDAITITELSGIVAEAY